MGLFHPENNLGLEIFFIGVVGMLVFELAFVVWMWYSDREWRKKQQTDN